MEKNESQYEKAINNIYARAEKAGTVKYDKEEFSRTYKELHSLILKLNRAYQDARTPIYQYESKQVKREKKKLKREGKREVKAIQKQIAKKEEILKPMFEQFEIGAFHISDAKGMLQRGLDEDLREEVRRANIRIRSGFVPEAKVDEGKAAEDASKNGENKTTERIEGQQIV